MDENINNVGADSKGSSRCKAALHIASAVLIMLLVSAAAGICFIIIAGSNVSRLISGACACILVLLPAFSLKSYAVLTGLRNRKVLFVLAAAGFVLSLYPVFCFYVSHDYELSVYRYMKTTRADVYYFGGIEAVKNEYPSAEDYIMQMKQAPASIVLQSMSREQLLKLSSEELKTINSERLWDYCGFDEILGSDDEEVIDSMEHAAETDAYSFTFDYRGLSPKSFGYMMRKPVSMLREAAILFRDGSHSASPATLVFFVIGQAFAIFMISLHFDVDAQGQLVYVYEVREHAIGRDMLDFFRSAYGKGSRRFLGRKRKARTEALPIPDISPDKAAGESPESDAEKSEV